MADNDQYNDEYQFADLDEGSPASESEAEAIGIEPEPESAPKKMPPLSSNFASPNVKRNAIIAVVSLILLIGLYKIIGSVFSSKKTQLVTPTPIVPVPQPATPTPASIQTPAAPSTVPEPPVAAAPESNVNTKLSELETSQQSIRSDVSSVNTQLTGIGDNINAMAQKMVELNNTIASLSAKVEEQSREIDRLMIKKETRAHSHHIPLKRTRPVRYYIQAVIPGRAWLIGTNGSTLTVREGTIIAGYGEVKLIDPNQGKVLTSSGHVIKFSQDDS